VGRAEAVVETMVEEAVLEVIEQLLVFPYLLKAMQ